MKIERKIPFSMSPSLEATWLGASRMVSFAQLPETTRDRAIAQFLRNRRPDLYDFNYLGDYLLWSLGAPCPSRSKETGSTATPVDLRMSACLLQTVQRISSGMDFTATPDPVWAAVLRLRSCNAEVFDFGVIADGLSYYLASMELQIAPE